MGSNCNVPRLCTMMKICKFRFSLFAALQSVHPCLGLYLNHHLKRRESQEDFQCNCWFVLSSLPLSTARQATPCNLQRSKLLTLYQTPGHQIVNRQVNNHGVNPMHYSGFQTPSYTKCILTSPKHPVGNIHHIIQLCLPCQSLARNKSKVFDLGKTLR